MSSLLQVEGGGGSLFIVISPFVVFHIYFVQVSSAMQLKGHQASVLSVSFSSDSQRLGTCVLNILKNSTIVYYVVMLLLKCVIAAIGQMSR